MGVGFPAHNKLEDFGMKVYWAFGHYPYHVGSSLMTKNDWRDVDVRLIISDGEYKQMGLGDPKYPRENKKMRALCEAFSELGKAMTGLPIDFQIQQRTWANDTYPNTKEEPNWRSCLGHTLNMVKHGKTEKA